MALVIAALPAFLASIVEFVEALTIVLAVGVTRQWRSTMLGVASAVVVLAVVVGIFGSAIVLLVPLSALRIVIGGFLVIYGLQWLVKAILRAGGARAKHDETAIYSAELAALRSEPQVPAEGMDWISFTVAFKGVLLEGMEVAFIVITFGASANAIGPAAAGAAAAGIIVIAAGLILRKPLARVPENGLKFVVGLMLTTFGTFWAGEGIGIAWPLEDLMLPILFLLYVLASLAAVAYVRERLTGRATAAAGIV